MEKIIYAVWKNSTLSQTEFNQQLLTEVAQSICALANCNKLTICVDDADITPAKSSNLNTLFPSLPDAVITVWVNTANEHHAIETQLKPCCETVIGYVVTESQPLVPERHYHGQRTAGMNQVVFLRKPERLSYQEWLDIWLNSHTKIAIETQSTFGYQQNVVARPLTDNAPRIDAIIEEHFPEPAIHSRAAFFAAEGDELKQKRHETAMFKSCARFIDFKSIDCMATSEYCYS